MSLEKAGLASLCWLALVLSAGATSSVESAALTEATVSAPPESAASWDERQILASLRVGLALGGMALSAGRSDLPALLAVANTEPHTLAVLDEQLKLLKLLRAVDKTNRVTSPVAKIRTIKARSSFIAAFTHMPELWEISYNPTAPEIAMGLVHDFQYQEGTFVPGYLNPKRSMLPSPATDFLVSQSGHEVVTAHAQSDPLHPGASARLQVTNLDVRRKVAEFAVPGWPAPGDAQTVLQLDNYAFEIEARLAGVGNDAAPSHPFVTDAGCTP